MGMAVIDGRRGDAGEEHELAAAHDDSRRIWHHHVGSPVGVVDDRDLLRHRLPPRKRARCGRSGILTRRAETISAPEYTGAMPVILVLFDDGAARDALVATLCDLFPRARVVAACGEAAREAVARENPRVVLASLDAAERLCRAGAPSGVRVVALTREMSPDTLLRAAALGPLLGGAARSPIGDGA